MPTALPDRTKFVLSIRFWEHRLPDPGHPLLAQRMEKGRRSNAAAALVRVFEVFSYRYEEEKFSLQLVLAAVWYKPTFFTML